MNFHPESEVVQLWHAAGAFKKFGLSAPTNPNLVELEKRIAKRLDYVVVSSQNIAPCYEEAFGVKKEKILPLGIPRTDYYFQEHDLKSLRTKFEKQYPASKNKKIVLYAPTFREDPKLDKNLLNNLDMDLFQQELGDNYILAVRLHPQINQEQELSPEIIDLTDYPDEKELLLLTDILVTDYSSIMVEYALLEKPVIFYPYDLEFYDFYERGFYYDYHELVPGPIARSNQELIAIIKEDKYDFSKIRDFKKSQFDHFDGKSSRRVVDYLIK
jgi:CDP-ribitol ribitolphosphotransferase